MGRLRGYLPNRWPSWFSPVSLDLTAEAFGPFATSRRLTDAGDVIAVGTPGHTADHVSVIVEDQRITYFLAGDASYNERLMLAGKIDGVAADDNVAGAALRAIREFARGRRTVYLPTHDPESARRLSRQCVVDAISPAPPLGWAVNSETLQRPEEPTGTPAPGGRSQGGSMRVRIAFVVALAFRLRERPAPDRSGARRRGAQGSARRHAMDAGHGDEDHRAVHARERGRRDHRQAGLARRPIPGLQSALKIIQDSDVGFGNFESLIRDERTFAGPLAGSMVGTKEVAADLKAMGFTLMNRAGNHLMDSGTEGISRRRG